MRGGRTRIHKWRGLLIALCLAALVATACATGRPASQKPTGQPAPTTGATPAAGPAPLPDLLCGGTSGRACQLTLFATEPDDGVGGLVARLDQATTSIDYSPFLLDEPTIEQALVNARRRGVRVRLLAEPSHDKDNAHALKLLGAAGVQIKPTSPAFALTHAKYVLLDGSRALLPTFNSTVKELPDHRDFALEDDDPDDVRFIQSVFNADWDRSRVGPIPPGFALAPDNADETLPPLMRSAQHSIDLYAEKLEASPLLDAILDAARRGVTVRIVADAPNKKVPAPLADAVRRHLVQIRVPHDLGIHAKVMLVDDRTAYFGSENIENATGDHRRELGVIFQDESIVGRLRAVFEGDWARPADVLG
jgi:phosphatidylserine/phosphatidylglycerophosphate/cardiolipin synthase-like enzyme